jgi:hypothetical protein
MRCTILMLTMATRARVLSLVSRDGCCFFLFHSAFHDAEI